MNLALSKIFYLNMFFLLFVVSAKADDCPDALNRLNKLINLKMYTLSKEESFKSISKLCPDLSIVDYEFGKFLFNEQRYSEAIKMFSKAYSNNPQLESAIALGNSHIMLNEYADAEKVFKNAISKFDSHWSSLEGLCILYFKLGRYKESEDLLRQALQDSLAKPSVYYNLGLVLEKLSRFDEALISFKTSLDKNSSLIHPRLAIMKRYIDSANYSEAKRIGEKGLFYHPESVDLLKLQVEILSMLEEFDNALELAERLNVDDPIEKEVIISVIKIKSGDKSELDNLKKMINENSENEFLLKSYGWALLKDKQYESAEQFLKQALDINPNDGVSLNNLGIVYENLGKKELAKSHFSRARTLLPYSDIVLINLERVQ